METFRRTKAKQGADHPDTLLVMSNLALGYRDVGKLNKALTLYQECFKIRKAKFGPDHHPKVAELVQLRYFGGLTLEQCAEALGTSPRTADTWWSYARAWLVVELADR